MASKSRSRKSGTSAASTRKAKNATPVDDVLTSSEPVSLAADSGELPERAVVESATAVKAPRRNTRKKSVTDNGPVAAATPKSPRKRSRKSAPKSEPAGETESASTAQPVVEAPAEETFADAFASAFLYSPEPEPAPEIGPEPELEPAIQAPPAAEQDHEEEHERPVELPFIIDIPRNVAVVDEAPADDWVDQVLEPAPRKPQVNDDWVDQVLTSPAKVTPAARSPRARAQTARTQAARVPTARPAAPRAAVKSASKAPAAVATPAAAARPQAETVTSTRWWMVLPVFLVAAVLLFVNRPGKKHAPVPTDLLGSWTTAFWLYEHQTLEIKPDTVVATLDEPDEGRYPITKVETSDAGRETAVKITYRNANGDEKVLDFLADKDPVTALRFRAHTGLVWVRAE